MPHHHPAVWFPTVRAGAAALGLAYVACGQLDGFWGFGLDPRDMAAGALLIEEAGGIVANIDGSGNYPESRNIMGGTPKLYELIKSTLNFRK